MTKLEKAVKQAVKVPEWYETGLIEEEAELDGVTGNDGTPWTFDQLVMRKDALDQIKKHAESELRVVADALLLMMNAREQKKVGLWDGMTFEVREGRSASKLEPTILLEQGVALEVIQAATVEGTPYQYVQINRPKVSVMPKVGG